MSKQEKRLAKLKQNPKNVSIHDLETILFSLGFEKSQGPGSHAIFKLRKHLITVPCNNSFLKAVYIKEVIKVINEIEEEAGSLWNTRTWNIT